MTKTTEVTLSGARDFDAPVDAKITELAELLAEDAEAISYYMNPDDALYLISDKVGSCLRVTLFGLLGLDEDVTETENSEPESDGTE